MLVHGEHQDLVRTLRGDLAAFTRVRHQPQDHLLTAQDALGQLLLPGDAVKQVLRALRSGSIGPPEAQPWAFFARRGFVGRWSADDPGDSPLLPIRRLAITYDPILEEAVAEAIARLDEQGDAVDGALSQMEIDALLQRLSNFTP